MNHLSSCRKRAAAWFCLAMMLFAQGAYAVHACVSTEAAIEAAAEQMPCHQQEQSDKNLCQNHCLANQQTLDSAKLPVVAPALVPVLFVPDAPAPAAYSSAPRAEVPVHPGAPPLAVLHCCFRI
jgi:hypothetical protein